MIRTWLIILLTISVTAGVYAQNLARITVKPSSNGYYDFYADNANFCPMQATITAPKALKEIISTNDLPRYFVIPAQVSDQYLFSIRIKGYREPELPVNVTWAFGDPSAVNTNQEFGYLFPFQAGTEQKLTQGNGTRFSHKGVNKYAFDFGLDLKTPVCAARGGVVVAVQDQFKKGGRKRYRSMANYITISHDDGTFAQYVHLYHKGSLVRVGDIVEAGQVIGFSGNTGWSRGPHLHFMVFVPTVMKRMSIPIRYLAADQQLISLKAKQTYIAYHPQPSTLPVASTVAFPQNSTNLGTEDDYMTNAGAPED